MRVVCVSDLHGQLPRIPDCDLLLVGGDLCPIDFESRHGDHQAAFQQRLWLETVFAGWLREAPADRIVGVAGNHDFAAAASEASMRALPWTYLLDESAEVGGVNIWGSPYSNFLPGWVFMEQDDELAARWAGIPENTNILLVHGPASGYLDQTLSGAHVGSASLRERLQRLPELRLFVCGHIHEGYTEEAFGYSQQGRPVRVVNASHVNFPGYEPVNPPIVVDL